MKTSNESRPEAQSSSISWSRTTRLLASLVIMAWLFLVVMGPVTNPVSTEELTGPIARALAPIHQATFLGHGYRFFAPDPGPSHRVLVRDEASGDSLVAFPDRDRIWPRLMYHRWFMLSETLWSEYQATPDREGFETVQKSFREQAMRFKLAGKHSVAISLTNLVDRNERGWKKAIERIMLLTKSVQNEMSKRTGHTVSLWLQERIIPFAADVVLGKQIDDPEYLSEPVSITGMEVIDP